MMTRSKRPWKKLLPLALATLLVAPVEGAAGSAEAAEPSFEPVEASAEPTEPTQRGRRNRGGGRRGGGRRGGGRRGGGRNPGAAEAKKAEKAAQERANELAKKKKAEVQAWAEAGKRRAQAREAALRSRTSEINSDLGPVFRSRCGSCHAVPDPAVPEDAAWIDALATTRCRELPVDVRQRMMDFLRTSDTFRPHTVSRYAEPAPGQAAVLSSVPGELFLSSEAGPDYRVSWAAGEEGEKRVVTPGRYVLNGYRVTKNGWTLSMSGGQRVIQVAPDGNVPLKLGLGLQAVLTVNRTVAGGQLNAAALNLVIHDAQGQSVSLYQNGRRVRIPFQVVDANGTSSQHGVMAYAAEGRAEAPISVPLGGASWARVTLPHDLPFQIGGSLRTALPAPR